MIRYEPSKLIKKIAPKKKIKALLNKDLSLKKTALSFVSDIEFLSKKGIVDTALKTIKAYKKRVKDDPDLKKTLLADPAQLIQRVQNEVVFQLSEQIHDEYIGEEYTWLPSSASEPDPEHQLNYGKVFVIGEGEMPGERFGCQCGMEIRVKDSSLKLD